MFVVTAAALYASLHIATLERARQAYFDDSFYASITDSLVQTGQFTLAVSPLWLSAPVYMYGPVYFLITGSIFKFLGVGIAQIRLAGLLFGFGILILVYSILRHERTKPTFAILGCILLALDPSFHQSIHSGRMDTTALFFVLVALSLLLRSRDAGQRAGLLYCLGSGVAAATAILTTPRPGYLLIPLGFVFLLRWYRGAFRHAALQLMAWGAPIALLCSAWVLFAFGGVAGLVSYYSQSFEQYAGIGSTIKPLQAPLVLAVITAFAVTLYYRPRQVLDEVTLFGVFGTLAYYLFVHDGPASGRLLASYTVLMVVPAYIALVRLLNGLETLPLTPRRRRVFGGAIVGLLVLINGAIFGARTFLDFVEWKRRDPAIAEEAVRRIIPVGSKVIGDESFYFAVKRSGSDFQYVERGGTLDERVAYHLAVYDFDYLISDLGEHPEVVAAYERAVPLRKVAEVRAPDRSEWGDLIVSSARRLGLRDTIRSGYEATIFERGRER